MTDTLFDVPQPIVLPIAGGGAGYPVGRIFCVGRNYEAHAAEMGNQVDREAPWYFTKAASHAILSGAQVPYPPGTSNFHYEMELAFAISKGGFQIPAAQAMDHVFGYCCALDMTRRDRQQDGKDTRRPWDLGKDVENGAVFAALTPASDWAVTPDARIHLEVNGETRQDATLSELVWSVAEIVSHLSRYYHLRPGDLVMTGTPAGVGPVVAGDKITGGIDGLVPIALTLGAAE